MSDAGARQRARERAADAVYLRDRPRPTMRPRRIAGTTHPVGSAKSAVFSPVRLVAMPRGHRYDAGQEVEPATRERPGSVAASSTEEPAA